MRRGGLALLLCLAAVAARAGEPVRVCYNYGCSAQAAVSYSEAQWLRVDVLLVEATTSVRERALLGVAVGWLLGWAGEQTPIGADRGGNLADDEMDGRMDCIDHATTATGLLQRLEARGALRFHRVLAPARRARLLLFEHFAAQIETLDPESGGRYVVDSWFFDNGQPAAVMSLARWQAGENPDDGMDDEYD